MRKQTQRLFNHYCEKIYDIILVSVDDAVYRKLYVKGLESGDGVRAYELLKQVYFTGTNVTLIKNFREFIRLKQNGSLTDYTYKFESLTSYFEQMGAGVNNTLAIMLYLEGLSPQHERVKERIIDESRTRIPLLSDVIQRVSHNAENGTRERKYVAQDDAHVSHDSKAYDPNTAYNCYNCGRRHRGGERSCSAPCRRCGSKNHVRYDCPEKPVGRKEGRGRGGRNRYTRDERRERQHRGLQRDNRAAQARGSERGDRGERKHSFYDRERRPRRGSGRGEAANDSCSYSNEAEDYGIDHGGAAYAGRDPGTILDGGASWHFYAETHPKDELKNSRRVTGTLNTASTPLPYTKMADIPSAHLKDVKLVKNIQTNLVSVSKLCDDRRAVYVHTRDGVYEMGEQIWQSISSRESKKFVARRSGNLYQYLGAEDEHAHYANTKPANPVYHLHQAMGHRSVQSLVQGIKRGTIHDQRLAHLSPAQISKCVAEIPVCKTCFESKSTKKPKNYSKNFPQSKISGNQKFQNPKNYSKSQQKFPPGNLQNRNSQISAGNHKIPQNQTKPRSKKCQMDQPHPAGHTHRLIEPRPQMTSQPTGRREGPPTTGPEEPLTPDQEIEPSGRIGETWQTDVCFPVNPALQGEKGFMLTIDTRSGYLLDAGIKTKGESATKLAEMMAPIMPQLPRSRTRATQHTVISDDCCELASDEARQIMLKIGVNCC